MAVEARFGVNIPVMALAEVGHHRAAGAPHRQGTQARRRRNGRRRPGRRGGAGPPACRPARERDRSAGRRGNRRRAEGHGEHERGAQGAARAGRTDEGPADPPGHGAAPAPRRRGAPGLPVRRCRARRISATPLRRSSRLPATAHPAGRRRQAGRRQPLLPRPRRLGGRRDAHRGAGVPQFLQLQLPRPVGRRARQRGGQARHRPLRHLGLGQPPGIGRAAGARRAGARARRGLRRRGLRRLRQRPRDQRQHHRLPVRAEGPGAARRADPQQRAAGRAAFRRAAAQLRAQRLGGARGDPRARARAVRARADRGRGHLQHGRRLPRPARLRRDQEPASRLPHGRRGAFLRRAGRHADSASASTSAWPAARWTSGWER